MSITGENRRRKKSGAEDPKICHAAMTFALNYNKHGSPIKI